MGNSWDNGATGGGLWGPNLAERNRAWSSVGLNPSGRYPGFDVGKRGIVDLMPILGQQIGFMKELEPIREQMIRNFITQNNPNNSNFLVDAARRNALSQATEGANQMAANGYGGGFTDPSVAMQGANEAGSNAYSMVHSPQYQAGLYSNVLGGVAQGQDISNVQNAMQGFHNMTLSTPRNASGLQAFGGLLGQGLQALGSMGGGGGGWTGTDMNHLDNGVLGHTGFEPGIGGGYPPLHMPNFNYNINPFGGTLGRFG